MMVKTQRDVRVLRRVTRDFLERNNLHPHLWGAFSNKIGDGDHAVAESFEGQAIEFMAGLLWINQSARQHRIEDYPAQPDARAQQSQRVELKVVTAFRNRLVFE